MLPDHSTSLHSTALLSSTNTLSSSATTTTSLTSSSNIPYSTSYTTVTSLSSSTNTLLRSVTTTVSLTSVVTGTHIPTTSSKFLSFGATTTSSPLSITDSSITRSSEPTAPSNTRDGNSALIIAAVVVTVLVLLIFSVIVILILITVAYKRRSKATLSFRGHNAVLVNSVYSDITPTGKKERDLKNMSNPNYQGRSKLLFIMYITGFYYPVLYEEPIPLMDGIEAVYSDTKTMSNPMYGQQSNTVSIYCIISNNDNDIFRYWRIRI